MTHVLIVAQYHHPEPFRITDIAGEVVQRGYRVTVVTGIPTYPEGDFYPGYGLFRQRREVVDGVEIHRIPLIPRTSKRILLGVPRSKIRFWPQYAEDVCRPLPDPRPSGHVPTVMFTGNIGEAQGLDVRLAELPASEVATRGARSRSYDDEHVDHGRLMEQLTTLIDDLAGRNSRGWELANA